MNLSKRYLLASAFFVVVSPIMATTITVNLGGIPCAPAGLCSAIPGATTITFDALSGSTLSPYTEGIATYSWSGETAPFVLGSSQGNWATPADDTTSFLTVGSPGRPGTVAINFSMPIAYFGFYMGSPDTYNSISFYDGSNGSLVRTFAGNDLINPGDGNWAVGDYVNFRVSGGGIGSIVMSSSAAAFETDNHSFEPVPEPGTWVLFAIGLTLTGLGWAKTRRAAR